MRLVRVRAADWAAMAGVATSGIYLTRTQAEVRLKPDTTYEKEASEKECVRE